jgi:uncharacterized membrane protein
MTDITATDRELWAWAKGSFPCQAAVEFLTRTGELNRHTLLVARTDGRAYLDVYDKDDFEQRIGYMSSGEKATWRLARSMVTGDLNDSFWSLDSDRGLMLLEALATNHH